MVRGGGVRQDRVHSILIRNQTRFRIDVFPHFVLVQPDWISIAGDELFCGEPLNGLRSFDSDLFSMDEYPLVILSEFFFGSLFCWRQFAFLLWHDCWGFRLCLGRVACNADLPYVSVRFESLARAACCCIWAQADLLQTGQMLSASIKHDRSKTIHHRSKRF